MATWIGTEVHTGSQRATHVVHFGVEACVGCPCEEIVAGGIHTQIAQLYFLYQLFGERIAQSHVAQAQERGIFHCPRMNVFVTLLIARSPRSLMVIQRLLLFITFRAL